MAKINHVKFSRQSQLLFVKTNGDQTTSRKVLLAVLLHYLVYYFVLSVLIRVMSTHTADHKGRQHSSAKTTA